MFEKRRDGISDEEMLRRIEIYKRLGSKRAAANEIGIDEKSFRENLRNAERRGLIDMGERFEPRDGLKITGESAYLDEDGNVLRKWVLTREDKARAQELMREAIEALKEEIPRVKPVNTHIVGNEDILNQYTITDLHFGQLSWREETGADYDLKIAEGLLLDWFSNAIRLAPDANLGILAQLGDLLHFDSLQSVTPTNRNVLDSDSRFAKIVRVVIRTLRRIIAMMLEKHEHVHIIMADANHDPASEIWLREMFAAFYENEPRLTVERSPSPYTVFEFGQTALFYHHGHRRKIKDVDATWVGKYREIYGRTKFAYGHLGHFHNDEFITTKLMKVERHATLAAPSSYEAGEGYISPRSAKVISYSKRFGEVARLILTPEMVTHNS